MPHSITGQIETLNLEVARIALKASHPGQHLRLEIANKALHRPVGILEPVLSPQIPVNALSAQSRICLRLRKQTERLAKTPVPTRGLQAPELAALLLVTSRAGGRLGGTF